MKRGVDGVDGGESRAARHARAGRRPHRSHPQGRRHRSHRPRRRLRRHHSVVLGLEDVSTYPALIAELLRRGYKDEDIRKITGRNILRVMRQAEKVSKTMRAERGPSMLLFGAN